MKIINHPISIIIQTPTPSTNTSSNSSPLSIPPNPPFLPPRSSYIFITIFYITYSLFHPNLCYHLSGINFIIKLMEITSPTAELVEQSSKKEIKRPARLDLSAIGTQKHKWEECKVYGKNIHIRSYAGACIVASEYSGDYEGSMSMGVCRSSEGYSQIFTNLILMQGRRGWNGN